MSKKTEKKEKEKFLDKAAKDEVLVFT